MKTKDDNGKVELKSCPFCGATVVGIGWREYTAKKIEGCQVICRSCYARGPVAETEAEAWYQWKQASRNQTH